MALAKLSWVKWAPEGSSGQHLTHFGASGCLAGHRSEPVADSWIPRPLGLGLESSWPLGPHVAVPSHFSSSKMTERNTASHFSGGKKFI